MTWRKAFLNKKYIPGIPQLVLFAFLVTGLFAFDDYGVSWDEEFSYRDCGDATWSYIATGDFGSYLQNWEKYHGPAFELTLIAAQKLFGITEPAHVYLFRHLLTFLLFWVSGVALWHLLRNRYRSIFTVTVGILLYFLMPRIFADAFYNSKDLGFLSLFTICLAAMFRLLEKPGTWMAILFGMLCGYLTAIRIMGILIPLAMAGTTAWHLWRSRETTYLWRVALPFAMSFCYFTILFWPILWIGPLHQFAEAWKEMSRYRWHLLILYRGHALPATDLPWHYVPFWIGITTPISYLLLTVTGIAVTIARAFRNQLDVGTVVPVLLFIAPIASVIEFQSTLYDGWRHMYFLHAPMCLVAVAGADFLTNHRFGSTVTTTIRICLVASLIWVSVQMYRMHPYENIYFNRLVGSDPNKLRYEYDLDYWGVSYRRALENLVKRVPDGPVSLSVAGPPGYHNAIFLKPRDRQRIIYFQKPEDAKYYITAFRWDSTDLSQFVRVDSIMAGEITISATYQRR